jgi:hypothetical protein
MEDQIMASRSIHRPSRGAIMRMLVAATVFLLIFGGRAQPQSPAEPMTPLVGQHREPTDPLAAGFVTAPTDPMLHHMEVTFAIQNRAASDEFLREQQDPTSPNYHRALSHQEVLDNFGPTQAQVDAIVSWLQQQGFQIARADRDAIWFDGTVGQAEAAFGVRILSSPDRTHYCNIDDPQIPSRFSGIIGGLLGLDNLGAIIHWSHGPTPGAKPSALPAPRSKRSSRSGSALCELAQDDSIVPDFKSGSNPLGLGVADMRTFYSESPLLSAGINGAPLSSSECIAVIADSDFSPQGVTTNPQNPGIIKFDSAFSLPSPVLTKIFADSPAQG